MVDLPPLPRVLRHKEADFGLQFRAWVKENWHQTATFELKQSRTDSIPFGCLEEHQVRWGIAEEKLVRVQGSIGENDYIFLNNIKSYIVIKFKSGFCIIPIEKFLAEKKKSDRKSLTFEVAKRLAIDNNQNKI